MKKILNNIMAPFSKTRMAIIAKVHKRTGYLLNTTRAQRRENRRMARKGRYARIRDFRPLGFLPRPKADLKMVSIPTAE